MKNPPLLLQRTNGRAPGQSHRGHSHADPLGPICGHSFHIIPASATPASLTSFHELAQEGRPLKVAFFGGSLTWGANASDPETTSWRGRMMRWLLAKYPKSQFTFIDAAIGGTGSALALSRIDRDVVPQKPDLVFLDFTVNDDAEGTDEQTLASYERVLRDLLSCGSAVFPVLLCFRHHVMNPGTSIPPRYEAHLKLASAYGLPAAKTLDVLRERLSTKEANAAELWSFPNDGAHPGDAGYAAFFEAIREDYERATTKSTIPLIPQATVFADLYPKRSRQVLREGTLPAGWTRQQTYRTAMWFDGLSSRWMGDVASARILAGKGPEPIEVKFRGSMVGIFGERDAISPPFRAWIDGKPILPKTPKEGSGNLWSVNTARFASTTAGAGRLFLWIPLANDLPDGEHVLRIEPDFTNAHPEAELRIESVCSAGR
jgi:lysophospholipase L1-like esterase